MGTSTGNGHEPAQPAPDVERLFERVPGWSGRARVVGLLDGGITNRNVLVDVEGDRFVLRLAGKDTDLLEIRRSDEVAAARRAAAHGFGPQVVAFLEPEGYLVSRFVEGTTLSAEAMRTPACIARIGVMLRTTHTENPLVGNFDAFAVPALHLAAAQSRGVVVPAEYGECAVVAERIASAFQASAEGRVPCHNDLLPANVLESGDGRLWLLDWEYAGNNDRYFDLGNLSVNSGFEADHEDALLAAYFGGVTPRRRARLRLMRLMSDLREAMWGVVQQGISELDFDYAGYAASHFERFAAAAASGDLDRLLDDAAAGPADPIRSASRA